MLKKDDVTKQVVYYQAGIGTYTNPVLKTPIISTISSTLDQMLAWNIANHIMGGYQFLMQNYTAGDKICIFGFSRGAFTARALAGMLQKVGLLPTSNQEQLSFAYTMYARDDDEGLKLSMAFKRAFSVDVTIEFLGVWDTVQSVGLIPHHLPFSGNNNAIVHFRHALALDEHRVKFFPSFCTGGKSKADKIVAPLPPNTSKHMHREGSMQKYETAVNNMTGIETDVEEVFFAGAHCDVGGGSVQNGTRHSLARISLRWMIRQCFRTNTGIIFDAHMLKHEVGLDVDNILQPPPRIKPVDIPIAKPEPESRVFILKSIWSIICTPFVWVWSALKKLRVSAKPPVVFVSEESRFVYEGEAEEELHDALSPVYDQIPLHWYWRLMEWIPFIIKKQSAEIHGSDDPWAYKLVWNRGAGRKVFRPVMRRGMKVHRSVKTRIEVLDKHGKPGKYIPKIRPVIGDQPRTLTVEEWLADNPEIFEWAD
jgi:hypothetical protein